MQKKKQPKTMFYSGYKYLLKLRWKRDDENAAIEYAQLLEEKPEVFLCFRNISYVLGNIL
jgi:hypothetical protein